jgi:hypothetical protein
VQSSLLTACDRAACVDAINAPAMQIIAHVRMWTSLLICDRYQPCSKIADRAWHGGSAQADFMRCTDRAQVTYAFAVEGAHALA